MSKKTKQKINSLKDQGISKEEILIEREQQIFHSSESLVFNREKEDVLSKIAVFISSAILSWFLLVIITSVISDLIGFDSNELRLVVIFSFIALFSIFIGYKLARKTTYKNSIRNIINLGILSYLVELILPSILTYLLFLFLDEKDSYILEEVTISFSIIFFLLVVLEWLRRYRDKKASNFLKYVYVFIMLMVFVFGLWYVTEIVS